jgi:hypothetical protein
MQVLRLGCAHRRAAPAKVNDYRPPGNVTLPPGLSADDRRLVERLLPQIYGDQGAATPTRLTDADVEALRQLDRDPDRAEILALMHTAQHRGGGGDSDPAQSLADLIDTVRQQVAIHRSAAQAPLSGEARHPLVPRPVHGHLRNRSGELVPGMDGQFDFVEDDVVDPRGASTCTAAIASSSIRIARPPSPARSIRSTSSRGVVRHRARPRWASTRAASTSCVRRNGRRSRAATAPSSRAAITCATGAP